MGSYQKADGITLSQLNNTEYTNFMNRVLTLLTAGSISKLTVTNIVNSIKPKLVQMEDLVNRSTANAETKDLLKLDAERDSYVSYLLATVRAAKNSPLAAQIIPWKSRCALIPDWHACAIWRKRQPSADYCLISARKP